MLSKKSQPLTVRRPIGLHGVARGNHSLGMCSNVHRPQLTGAWISAATFVVDDVVIVERHFAPIRRPRRIEACFGDLRDVISWNIASLPSSKEARYFMLHTPH